MEALPRAHGGAGQGSWRHWQGHIEEAVRVPRGTCRGTKRLWSGHLKVLEGVHKNEDCRGHQMAASAADMMTTLPK